MRTLVICLMDEYRKLLLFWLWMFAIAFVIGAWLAVNADAQEIPEEDVNAILLQIDEDGTPVVALDILKAFASEDVKKAWSEAGEFSFRMPLDLIQAIVRTGYEPLRETGEYATQSPWHLAGVLGTALVGTRAVQGKLGDDIDDIVDLFDSSDSDNDALNNDDAKSSLEASGPGSEILIKDAKQSLLSIKATDGGRVEVDFQTQ